MEKFIKQIKAVGTPTVLFSDMSQVCRFLARDGVPSGTYGVGTRKNKIRIAYLETESDNLELAIRHEEYVFQLPLIKTGFRGSYSLCVCLPSCGPTDFEVFKVLWNKTHGYEMTQFEDEAGNRIKLTIPPTTQSEEPNPILQVQGTTCSTKVKKSKEPHNSDSSDGEEESTHKAEEVLDEKDSKSSKDSGTSEQAEDATDLPAQSEHQPNEGSSEQKISERVDDGVVGDPAKGDSGPPSKPERSNPRPTKPVRPVMSESERNERNLVKSLLPKSVRLIEMSTITLGAMVGGTRFSIVYKASLRTGKRVAAKKMYPGLVESASFGREVEALAALRHHSVLDLVGVCLDGERLVILTEYHEKGSLHGYLRGADVESRTPQELVCLAQQVASGMEYIAGQGWIHGDLACEHILLTSALECKITGFGSSSSPTDQPYSVNHPHSYTAAVEIHQNKAITSKSDVWSFGIVFMQIMSRGETPYRGLVHPSQLKVYLEIGNRWKRPDCVSYNHYAIMQRCWRLKPRARPSFQQLVADLAKYKHTNWIEDK